MIKGNKVSRTSRRNPKNYDGTALTTHRMNDLLSNLLSKIGELYEARPDLILTVWPEVIGQKLALMTQAVSFTEGVLVVKVSNSTLHNLLTQYEKPRILNDLRRRFPRIEIKNIVFRIG